MYEVTARSYNYRREMDWMSLDVSNLLTSDDGELFSPSTDSLGMLQALSSNLHVAAQVLQDDIVLQLVATIANELCEFFIVEVILEVISYCVIYFKTV